MALSFTCPRCGQHYPRLKKSLAGRKVRCKCGHQMRIGKLTEPKPPNRASNSNHRALRDRAPLLEIVDEKVQSEDSTKHAASSMKQHYSDLDQILTGSGVSNSPFVPTPGLRSTGTRGRDVDRVSSKLGSPPSASDGSIAARKPSSTRMAISFLSVVASASLAFWFGSLIVATRFTTIDQFMIRQFSATLSNVNQGRFGLDEIAPTVKIGFVVGGWLIWLLAVAMVALAVMQFANAVIQLFVQRLPLRWIDGLLGAGGVAMVFLFVAMLFLFATHTAKLNRDLNRFDSVEAVLAGESELQNVQRLREKIADDSQRFTTVMLVAGSIPLAVFGFSMIRLFTRRS